MQRVRWCSLRARLLGVLPKDYGKTRVLDSIQKGKHLSMDQVAQTYHVELAFQTLGLLLQSE